MVQTSTTPLYSSLITVEAKLSGPQQEALVFHKLSLRLLDPRCFSFRHPLWFDTGTTGTSLAGQPCFFFFFI